MYTETETGRDEVCVTVGGRWQSLLLWAGCPHPHPGNTLSKRSLVAQRASFLSLGSYRKVQGTLFCVNSSLSEDKWLPQFVLNAAVSRVTPLTAHPLTESWLGSPFPRLGCLCMSFSSALVQGSSISLHLSRPDLPSGRDMDTMSGFTFITPGLWVYCLFSGLSFPKKSITSSNKMNHGKWF